MDRLAAAPALDAGVLERNSAEQLVEHLLQANDDPRGRNPAVDEVYRRFTEA
jgi:hypothetical protein